jgi:hypothetical protein
MANVKVSIWHNRTGEIVAVGRSIGERKAVALGGETLSVLEVEIAEEEIESLPNRYLVDSSRNEIIRRPPDYGGHGPSSPGTTSSMP